MRKGLPVKQCDDQRVEVLAPLADYYAAIDKPLPQVGLVTPAQIPTDLRRLLVHTRDMTPTLEAFHGQTLMLRVLRKAMNGRVLERAVVLCPATTVPAVAFGAIQINLNVFGLAPRQAILASHVPLGAILRDHMIDHVSHPSGYFTVESDDVINDALGLDACHVLYGRHNQLSGEDGQPLAQVVEILPPSKLIN